MEFQQSFPPFPLQWNGKGPYTSLVSKQGEKHLAVCYGTNSEDDGSTRRNKRRNFDFFHTYRRSNPPPFDWQMISQWIFFNAQQFLIFISGSKFHFSFQAFVDRMLRLDWSVSFTDWLCSRVKQVFRPNFSDKQWGCQRKKLQQLSLPSREKAPSVGYWKRFFVVVNLKWVLGLISSPNEEIK